MFSIVTPFNLRRHEEAFIGKVKHNFKLHVMLYLKSANWNRHNILRKIFSLNGYRCHKVVKYGKHWSHIHIKFLEEQHAREAVRFFTTLNYDLSAILIHDLLRDWHDFEMRCTSGQSWTHTIVDIVGTTPKSLNFLTENFLNYTFQDFGQSYLLPYTAAFNEAHVQIVFESMTQALAAGMAFGQWYQRYKRSDQFCYRVRINPSQKEALLIKNSGGIPEEAFKLDYFVTAKCEMNRSTIQRSYTHHSIAVQTSNCDRTFNRSDRVTSKFKEDKSSKQNCYPQTEMYSPIVFIPIISSYFSVSSNQTLPPVQMVNSGFNPALLNLQNDSNVLEQIHPLPDESDLDGPIHRCSCENSTCSECSYVNNLPNPR